MKANNVVLKIGKFSGVGVARKRADGSQSIRIKDVTKNDFALSEKRPSLQDVISANEVDLKSLERAALSEIKNYLSKNRLPVNVSFSGGKDSLACLCLAPKGTLPARGSLHQHRSGISRDGGICAGAVRRPQAAAARDQRRERLF